MSDKPKVYVASVGMITSVGANAAMTAAAVRAGISRYEESPIMNEKYLPMKVSFVPDEALPEIEYPTGNIICQQTRYRRMLRLAVPALNEMMASYTGSIPIPLFLAGPENLHDYLSPLDGGFIKHMIKLTGANIDVKNSRFFYTGRAGGFSAIEMAFRYFQQTQQPYVLVGGVDSYMDLDLLGAMERDDRILSVSNSDGFVAGEGAGFLLLATEQGLSQLANKPLAYLGYPGVAMESGHRYSDEPYKGDGLAEAFGAGLSVLANKKIKSVFSSLNGEQFGAKEYAVATVRNSQQLDPELDTHHPIENFGDVGAALSPIMIGMAGIGLNKGYYRGPGLVYCSSEKEHRAACCISRAA